MKRYCRYCSACSYGDVVYCDILKKTMTEKQAKRGNNCKYFIFNEVDVFDITRTYKPRKKTLDKIKQMQMETKW